MFTSKIHFVNKLPAQRLLGPHSIVLYDEIFGQEKWLKSFTNRKALKSGEGIKSLKAFSNTLEYVHKKAGSWPKNTTTIVALGGGSIGDLSGFVASVYKRGVNLIHLPTTWLAALDSSHGGKTALNLKNTKNQIGTVYPASKIFIVKSVLQKQPPSRQKEAIGEVLKTAVLNKKLFLKLENLKGPLSLWKLLPQLIRIKLSYSKKDLFEKKGIRTKLNLGHTLGHVIETLNHLPHGVAVAWGLVFALELSCDLNLISLKNKKRIHAFLKRYFLNTQKNTPYLNLVKVKKIIFADKKNQKTKLVRFVLIKNVGQTTIVNVDFKTVEKTLKRLKWV